MIGTMLSKSLVIPVIPPTGYAVTRYDFSYVFFPLRKSLFLFLCGCLSRFVRRGKLSQDLSKFGITMTWNHYLFAFLFFLLSTSLAASSFIADNVFDTRGSTGRNLLQATTSCPVGFEFLNYTIITSQCKGPLYPSNLCCGALKEFACPYAEQLNDGTNDCASTMFSYINLYGNYPPGLFANECHDTKQGLTCDAQAPAENVNANGAWSDQTVPHLLLLTGLLVVLLQML
ncbi:hypothetical protein NE237_013411 [Protea cynaroides]|uniref:GPI-anchored protein LLG1-like domain-containing protein n=1 Tax=Protea cynaroides TaxID=273540 RepID=A0A9Q0K059_9MAGN|nr:hypothetical protein NE237_013411 [Protea cynaroides]